MKKAKNIVIANWKMNPASPKEAQSLYRKIRKVAVKLQNVTTIICPPFLYLSGLLKLSGGRRVLLGAQDVFFEEEGPYTGEISPTMLKNMGVAYVIVGHSERRAMGESNEVVNLKVKKALKRGLGVILCIGERERDGDGAYLSAITEELSESLSGVPSVSLSHIIIAYEPIWAVGPSAVAVDTPEDIREMVIFIRKVLGKIYTNTRAMNVPVLYGGSVNPKNAEGILASGGVSGFLVGRASRDSEKFKKILKIADTTD